MRPSKTKKIFTHTCAQFVKQVGGHTEIWASSTDWFQQSWGRDTFIALPGLLLSNQKYAEARSVFGFFAAQEQKGVIPNRILPEKTLYNNADGSLWFLSALDQYWQATGDLTFLAEMFPTIRNILHNYHQGTGFHHHGHFQAIKADADGLLVTPAQATWMDADPAGNGTTIVTPRNGKAVEINALWYAALGFGAQISKQLSHQNQAQIWTQQQHQVKTNFDKFWNESENCLLDVIDGDPHAGALRPNQIFAISHAPQLLPPKKAHQIFTRVTQDLLTPWGLRTLSPRDSHYHGHYDTQAPMAEKDQAYHQGTVWPWLMGAYIDALFIVQKSIHIPPKQIQSEAGFILTPLLERMQKHKTLPEVFCGDAPHTPGGTRSQAWSVSEIWRVCNHYKLI